MNNNKRKIMMSFFLIILFFSLLTIFTTSSNAEHKFYWNTTLHFSTEDFNKTTFIVIGEDPATSDELDEHDTPIPPTPQPPYIYAYFTTDLPNPYNRLWEEYKQYPDTYKIWNFTTEWSESPTTVTITWDNTALAESEYDTILLWKYDELADVWNQVADMLNEDSYSWTHPYSFLTEDYFQIECILDNNPPYTPRYLSPENNSKNIGKNTMLTWEGGDPDINDTIRYDVYFGTENPPSLIISNQSSTSFSPELIGQTTYFWQIRAWDQFHACSIGPICSFTTKDFTTDTNPPSIDPSPSVENIPPIANITTSTRYTFPNSQIIFNASNSKDPDGYITKWIWDFGDGQNGSGEIITHFYSSPGEYTVELTVYDNKGSSDTTSIQILIQTGNHPPSKPLVTTQVSDRLTKTYEFAVISTDKDNDLLTYQFHWGDGNNYTTDFFESNQTCYINYTWNSSGIYDVYITAKDKDSVTKPLIITLLINAIAVDNLGYFIDYNEDGFFDSFLNNNTNQESELFYENNSYLLDVNGDGVVDHTYHISSGMVTQITSTSIAMDNDSSSLVLLITLAVGFTLFLIIFVGYIKIKKNS